ncbi:putative reverse transcriptase zinc-binding domain-containing protein [Helianthus annuus]|nr:putative reverse transcriptase zinc-binding domain-containing protein [Helianthus annuus]
MLDNKDIKVALCKKKTFFYLRATFSSVFFASNHMLNTVINWGGSDEVSKMAWTAWENAVVPIKYGGLGFGSLRDANLALLAKWWWRFKTEKDGLWRKLVWAIHSSSRSWNLIPCKVAVAGPWKQICGSSRCLASLGIELPKNIVGLFRCGTELAFWIDVWVTPDPLCVLFPSLFQLERVRGCSVAQRFRLTTNGLMWVWDWRRQPERSVEVVELQHLTALLQHVSASTGADSWVWKLDESGSFNVASIKREIISKNCVIPAYVMDWNNWVPKKVGIVAWRAQKERLPTRFELSRRGIPVQSLECAICGAYTESSEHLFISCELAQIVWQLVYQWCKAHSFFAFRIIDILEDHKFYQGSVKRKKAFHAVCLITIWSLWKSRNERIFSGTEKSITNILEEIKATSFMWVKNRAKSTNLTWEQWKCFDVF